MQFAVGLYQRHPINPELVTGEVVADFARTAETAGFGAVYLTEHPIPDDEWLDSGGHDALDPFVGLAFAAAATSRIRLLTNLTVLPYRNPFLLAKTVATLDRLSGGRVILGAGAGYLGAEYSALGVDFDTRNDRFDESLEVLRLAWSGRSVVYESPRISATGNTALPTPLQDVVPISPCGGSPSTPRGGCRSRTRARSVRGAAHRRSRRSTTWRGSSACFASAPRRSGGPSRST